MAAKIRKNTFKVVNPSDLTDAEDRAVSDLISTKAVNKNASVRDAYRIVLAKYDGNTFGCMALKPARAEYMQKLIGRSGASGLTHDALELVWICIKDSKVGQGFEKNMYDALVAAKLADEENGARSIFAVYKVGDAIETTLEALGLRKHDHDHEGLNGSRVQLWLG
jgi:hypothetical protein